MIALKVQDIHKSFDHTPILRGLSLNIANGEIACLLGPSASGKTTLLRIIAGLEQADSGTVLFDGRDMLNMPVHERGFGLMFQDLALFPHRNVLQNVAFGLEMQNLPQVEVEKRVYQLLDLVGIRNLAKRDVNQLSGGEQQRVALARALAPQPRFLMFDEPLGALDRILREQLVVDVRAILKKLAIPSLYVTHDQNEAFAIADRVFVIHNGAIVQSGTPSELYDHPTNAFVAQFLGMENLLPGHLIRTRGRGIRAKTKDGVFVVSAKGGKNNAPVTLLIRSDAAEKIAAGNLKTWENTIAGIVIESRFHEGRSRVQIKLPSGSLLTLNWDKAIATGTQVRAALNPEKILVLNTKTEKRR